MKKCIGTTLAFIGLFILLSISLYLYLSIFGILVALLMGAVYCTIAGLILLAAINEK